ncbi:alkaline phosphatase D family protein [Hirschia litorea]|uniref:Alkaline phosphatase D family protein n=1 Tax=Hirschia litorea TaxID=1199156 RepID=A0ABW2IPH3_9PROT
MVDKPSTTRRTILKSGAAIAVLSGCQSTTSPTAAANTETKFSTQWDKAQDRIFVGGEMWANPMEDWIIKDGSARTRTSGAARNIQLITHQLSNPLGGFEMRASVKRLTSGKLDGGAGFRLGVRSDINDYRANAFANNGIIAGIHQSTLTLGSTSAQLKTSPSEETIHLAITSTPKGKQTTLTLTAEAANGDILGQVSHDVTSDDLLGNVALVHNFANGKKASDVRYAFEKWSVDGPAFTVKPERAFGPILWSMYAISDSRTAEGKVFKMSVLTAPMGEKDSKDIELQIKRDGAWTSIATAQLDTDAWTAVFRIPNWDSSKEYSYRAVYQMQNNDGTQTPHEWGGIIQAEPKGRPLRLAALTCQKDYGFPYEPVAKNVAALNPDLVFFSGDQIYENHGGFGLIREPADLAILNYLRKYYQHGWAFREVMRNAPTLCIPDDHDVFQGNYWGEGGADMKGDKTDKMASSERGGYIEPVKMVNAVHRSTTAHHPDFFDPTPAKRNMSVYYGDMVYGDVGFAILGDRQFKSGPEHVDTGEGRADHVPDDNFDTSTLDVEGLELLGERQEHFLTVWRDDWRGHSVKVLLSQTLFANTATHHGPDNNGLGMYLKGDLDSGGWPQTPRNRAIDIIRPTQCLHVNGDQHLTSLVQYGVKEQRDSTWSFCTPAISAGYPRFWRPEEVGYPHTDRPAHGLPNTGKYKDGFGNLVYVYAVGYPEAESMKNRYQVAHQKGSGFGLITINQKDKSFAIDSYKFLIDINDPPEKSQFAGWPVTITADGKVAGIET